MKEITHFRVQYLHLSIFGHVVWYCLIKQLLLSIDGPLYVLKNTSKFCQFPSSESSCLNIFPFKIYEKDKSVSRRIELDNLCFYTSYASFYKWIRGRVWIQWKFRFFSCLLWRGLCFQQLNCSWFLQTVNGQRENFYI